MTEIAERRDETEAKLAGFAMAQSNGGLVREKLSVGRERGGSCFHSCARLGGGAKVAPKPRLPLCKS